MTFQWAIRNVLKYPFNQEKPAANKKWLENSAASKKWLRFFLKMNPVLRMRNPEGISAARVKVLASETWQDCLTSTDLY